MTEMFERLMDDGCAGLSLTLSADQKEQFYQYKKHQQKVNQFY